MKAAPTDLGPTFAPAKRQPNPSPKVHDLGIEMRWGRPQHTARLYRNIRDDAPQIFDFDCGVIHEDDARGRFGYQEHLARKTRAGTFYPLTAYMVLPYADMGMTRNIFAALAELDPLLPPERHVTDEDIASICRTLGDAKPSPPEPRADPPTGVMAKDLEVQGYRVTHYHIVQTERALLNIDWLPRPGGHQFFTGILEIRPTENGVAGQWMLPGPCGVNHLLRAEFEKLCAGPGTCLTPEGRRRCLAGVKPLPKGRKPAKEIIAWPTDPFQSTTVAQSSSSPSPTGREPI